MLFFLNFILYASGFGLFLQEQVFTENDGFYAWMFLKRRTLWQTVLSFVWPLFALAVCLFPVYPYQCKIVVLYSCAGALLFIVSILLRKISPSLSNCIFIHDKHYASVDIFNITRHIWGMSYIFFACVVLRTLLMSVICILINKYSLPAVHKTAAIRSWFWLTGSFVVYIDNLAVTYVSHGLKPNILRLCVWEPWVQH